MKPRRRLLYYILLNVCVSALVTATIIFFYDRARRADCMAVPPAIATIQPGADDVNVEILGVIGVGTLSDERIVIQNSGSQALVLTAWYLEDDKSQTYTFPQLTLYPGGSVQVYTRAGTDTLPDLYWGRAAPVWTSGELAALYDDQNIARAFYRVP